MIQSVHFRFALLLVFLAAATACGGGKRTAATDSATANSAMLTNTAPSTVPAPAASASGSVPPVIDSIGAYGESLYDEVKAGRWAKAQHLTDQLTSAAKEVPNMNSTCVVELTSLVDSLRATVRAHQQHAALVQSNQVTRLAAEMTRPYTSLMPLEVLLMDYQGRELDVWSAAKDVPRLKQTTADIRRTWDALRPRIESRNHMERVRTTDAIVSRIEAAKTPAQWGAAAKPLLDEVDELEKVFASK